MANLKNFHPQMTLSESEWFDKCPKAVLFEIARQFAMRVADDFTADAAFATMQAEWQALYDNQIVPQKPAKVRDVQTILSKMHPEIRKFYDDNGNPVRGG
jgi:hypothetical protein